MQTPEKVAEREIKSRICLPEDAKRDAEMYIIRFMKNNSRVIDLCDPTVGKFWFDVLEAIKNYDVKQLKTK